MRGCRPSRRPRCSAWSEPLCCAPRTCRRPMHCPALATMSSQARPGVCVGIIWTAPPRHADKHRQRACPDVCCNAAPSGSNVDRTCLEPSCGCNMKVTRSRTCLEPSCGRNVKVTRSRARRHHAVRSWCLARPHDGCVVYRASTRHACRCVCDVWEYHYTRERTAIQWYIGALSHSYTPITPARLTSSPSPTISNGPRSPSLPTALAVRIPYGTP